MIGGYQILDLRSIGLELSGSTQNITNAGILNQLRILREFIEKGHAYGKPLNNSMKTIIVRYRDAKNGEKIEAVENAGIYCSNDSLTYEIKTKDLMIEVVFEEKTNDDGVKYYDIKTAKYLYNHDLIVEGGLDVGGNLSVGGDVDIDGDIDSDGKIEGSEIVEKMSGYSFVRNESEGFTYEGIFAGVVKTGNKITFVIACNITKTDATKISCNLAKFNVPSSIASKLYPSQVGTYEFLDVREIQCSINEGVHAFVNGYVEKQGNIVSFTIDDNIGDQLTVNEKYYLRYELTLLLSDNLIPND